DRPGQGGRLGQGQLPDRPGEVVLGRGGDAVDAVAEVHLVQVGGQDPVLAGRPLQRGRVDRLDQLAVQAAPVAGDDVLDVLLGDGAAALAEVAAGQVDRDRPRDAAEVERAMLVVAGVLGGQDGGAGAAGGGPQRPPAPV